MNNLSGRKCLQFFARLGKKSDENFIKITMLVFTSPGFEPSEINPSKKDKIGNNDSGFFHTHAALLMSKLKMLRKKKEITEKRPANSDLASPKIPSFENLVPDILCLV